jgi:hypothetical protein
MKSKKYSPNVQTWIEARKKFRLSEAHVQMAKKLGLNPKKLGKIGNYKQEPWKMPLPDFIESLYEKRFFKLHKGKNKAATL